MEDLAKTRSNTLADYYGVEHPPLRGHDALDDALSVAYALHHLLKIGKLRQEARARKDFAEADRLREELLGAGWEVRDVADPPGFRLVPRS